MKRHGNTAIEMVNGGEWQKVGRKHYRHVSGIEIEWDCMAWGWRVSGQRCVWSSLWAARWQAEQYATQGLRVYA